MSAGKTSNNIQDSILNRVRKDRVDLVIYLNNGVPLKGRIASFDNFTFIVENDGKQSLVYKHAVSTIVFPKNIKLDRIHLEEASGDSKGEPKGNSKGNTEEDSQE